MQNVSSIVGPDQNELSLSQTQFKGDGTPAGAPQQTGTKVLDRRRLFPALNGLVENAIIPWRLRPGNMRPAKRPAAAMTRDEERELREQLARLQQEHRDLDAAIAALGASPASDLIQVQRLKKRKLVLRDKIRIIEDQLTPDIIA
jgi:hypothetical protein